MEYQINDYKVREIEIIGTDLVILEAWRKVGKDEVPGRSPSNITTIEGETWGRIGTDPDHNLFAELPAYSQERLFWAKKAYDERFEFAYNLILQARPDLLGQNIKKRSGEISYTK